MVTKIDGVSDSTGILIGIPVYALLLVFQSVVIAHFLFKIRGRELSLKIKVATLSVLFVAWIGICFEFITILLNLSFELPTQNGYCDLVIWIRYNWFIIFEGILYIFWLVRIYHTFKFSVFEIKIKYTYMIASIVFFLCTIFFNGS